MPTTLNPPLTDPNWQDKALKCWEEALHNGLHNKISASNKGSASSSELRPPRSLFEPKFGGNVVKKNPYIDPASYDPTASEIGPSASVIAYLTDKHRAETGGNTSDLSKNSAAVPASQLSSIMRSNLKKNSNLKKSNTLSNSNRLGDAGNSIISSAAKARSQGPQGGPKSSPGDKRTNRATVSPECENNNSPGGKSRTSRMTRQSGATSQFQSELESSLIGSGSFASSYLTSNHCDSNVDGNPMGTRRRKQTLGGALNWTGSANNFKTNTDTNKKLDEVVKEYHKKHHSRNSSSVGVLSNGGGRVKGNSKTSDHGSEPSKSAIDAELDKALKLDKEVEKVPKVSNSNSKRKLGEASNLGVLSDLVKESGGKPVSDEVKNDWKKNAIEILEPKEFGSRRKKSVVNNNISISSNSAGGGSGSADNYSSGNGAGNSYNCNNSYENISIGNTYSSGTGNYGNGNNGNSNSANSRTRSKERRKSNELGLQNRKNSKGAFKGQYKPEVKETIRRERQAQYKPEIKERMWRVRACQDWMGAIQPRLASIVDDE